MMTMTAPKRPQRSFDPSKLASIDIPQAPLPAIRQVLIALRTGAQTQVALIEATGFSRRHIQYRLQAARVLRLVELDGYQAQLTALGEAIARAEPGSAAARDAWRQAIATSPVLERLAPELLEEDGPTHAELVIRIMALSTLGHSTAHRRARDLLTWRAAVRQPQ